MDLVCPAMKAPGAADSSDELLVEALEMSGASQVESSAKQP